MWVPDDFQAYYDLLNPSQLIVNGPYKNAVSKFSLEKAKIIAESSFKVLAKAVEVGVNVAYGTDCPVQVQLAEFDLRAKVIPGKEILKQATCNAGKCRLSTCG